VVLPKSLTKGYLRFRHDRYEPERARYLQLADLGQSPIAMVIACCDARVDVASIFDAQPGELFILRNVANLVPPCESEEASLHGTSAAIEFALLALKVPNLIVLGHTRCGGISAYRQGLSETLKKESRFISRWISLLDEAKPLIVSGAEEDPQLALERAAVRLSLKNLRTFPVVVDAEREGRVALHGAQFDIRSGEVAWLDEESNRFRPLSEA
jgi:carbonic anhydrase